MHKEPYKPTPEERDRWREEMTHWKEADLVNKTYYDMIFAQMAELQERTGRATIDDLFKAMRAQGNERYFLAFDYLDPAKIVKPFTRDQGNEHESSHCFLRVPHTPEGEQVLDAYHAGLEKVYPFEAKGFLASTKQRVTEMHMPYYRAGVAHRMPHASERNVAINYAAGRYVNHKMNWLYQRFNLYEDTPIPNQDVLRQAICDYSKPEKDHDLGFTRRAMNKNLPYQFLEMAPEEWRAIVGVATGLLQPEETPYPKRMARIQKDVIEAGLLNDMKPWAERLKANAELSRQSDKVER